MILQRIWVIVGDAGFEPGTSASEVWHASNEPPHLLFCFKQLRQLLVVNNTGTFLNVERNKLYKLPYCTSILLCRFVTRLKTDVGSKYAEVEQVAREDLNIILERYHHTGTCTANKWDTGTLA